LADSAHDDDALIWQMGPAGAVREAFETGPTVLMSMAAPDRRIARIIAACPTFLGRPGVIGKPYRIDPEVAGQQLDEHWAVCAGPGKPQWPGNGGPSPPVVKPSSRTFTPTAAALCWRGGCHSRRLARDQYRHD